MDTPEEYRPNPDELLNALKKEEEHANRGKLKIFFGMCAGAGKTYDMLKSAHEAKAKGVDVVVGYVETHKRPETSALIDGLPMVPRKKVRISRRAIRRNGSGCGALNVNPRNRSGG